jgi:uncharacterized protein YcbK (DUF882 family)
MLRRHFLALSAAAATAAFAPLAIAATPSTKRLFLYDTHTESTIDEVYAVDGWYDPDAVYKFNHFLRDWRSGEVRQMDTALLDILHDLQGIGDRGQPIHIICGYRSRATNAMLARRSRGVARNSFHIAGRAADIRMPGVGLRRLRANAIDLQAGGVGYYPRSDFVHVDTGDIRTW